jgi:sulfur-oxidizing protein SoxY
MIAHDRARRRLCMAAAAGSVLSAVPLARALAAIDGAAPLIQTVTAGVPLHEGRVKLEIPTLSDNGHAVPLRIVVDSPMTEKEFVRSVHVIAEKNPRPMVAAFHLSPHCGRADIATRIRLNGAQHVLVVAALSDGTFWAGSAEVIVTETACLDAS